MFHSLNLNDYVTMLLLSEFIDIEIRNHTFILKSNFQTNIIFLNQNKNEILLQKIKFCFSF